MSRKAARATVKRTRASLVRLVLWASKEQLVPPVRLAMALSVLQANKVLPVPLVSRVKPERGAEQDMW